MKEAIGVIAALLGFVAYYPYLRDILARKANPHPYSWFIWGLTSVMIFALQISNGAGAGAYTTGTVAFISFLVCALAFRNDGRKDITRSDTLFFAMALIAAGVWLFAKQPTLAMILLITTDLLGLAPSLRKVWNKPYGETLSMWSINVGRHALSIFALSQFTLLTLLNPVAWTIANAFFCLVIIARRRSKVDIS